MDGLTSVYAFDDGRLLLHRCPDCGHVRLLAAGPCPACLGDGAIAEPAEGSAVVHAFTVVHRMVRTIWTGELTPPYVVAIVELREGVRMMSNIVGPGADGVAVGDAVRLVVRRRSGALLPLFTVVPVGSAR